MAKFSSAFEKVIKLEGGYVNDPKDKGGETYLGISRVHHPKSPMWFIIDNIKNINPNISNKNLTANLKKIPALDEYAEKIYKTKYWDKMRLDELNSQRIATELFDMAVNAGVSQAVKLAQRVIGDKETGRFDDALFNKLQQYGL